MLFECMIHSSGKETAMHCHRVGEYARIFLSKDSLGYSKEEVDCIVKGASYHDIGKAKIDKNILYKSGGLTDEEFEMIKQHSVIGYEILMENSNLLTEQEKEICSKIVLLHHKRIDGGGYPKTEDDIPLYVQLISILDAFDALTSERCYQKSRSREEALTMIRDGKCGGKMNKELIEKVSKFIDKVL